MFLNKDLLYFAAEKKNTEIVEMILKNKNIDINEKTIYHNDISHHFKHKKLNLIFNSKIFI